MEPGTAGAAHATSLSVPGSPTGSRSAVATTPRSSRRVRATRRSALLVGWELVDDFSGASGIRVGSGMIAGYARPRAVREDPGRGIALAGDAGGTAGGRGGGADRARREDDELSEVRGDRARCTTTGVSFRVTAPCGPRLPVVAGWWSGQPLSRRSFHAAGMRSGTSTRRIFRARIASVSRRYSTGSTCASRQQRSIV